MSKPLALSRTALDQFLRCPRCFYLERKLGLKAISMVPLTLAVATDALLKNEFDAVRPTGAGHPVWVRHGLKVRALQHPDIEDWRNFRRGIRVEHESGIPIYGAVDDVWENLETGEWHIVDYKSTSKKGIPSIDQGGWGDAYKRQMEVYQWLFQQARFPASPIGYFLYVNGSKQGLFYDPNESGLNGHMNFETTLITYTGNTQWVSEAVEAAICCHQSDEIPDADPNCDACRYSVARAKLESSAQ